jgi:predicted O-methyltransferase YrrM
MSKSTQIHSICAFLKHFFSSWNTTGEGIHSPYLFELVRFVLRDRNAYYCFADIERRREYLKACDDELDVVDFGSRGSKEGTHIRRKVSFIAKNHLESPKVGQMLFRLVNFLGEHEKRPLQILELGTSLGITTAYLASPDSRNNVRTFEGSGEVLKVAQGVWRALKLENIQWYEGNIDQTLLSTDSSLLNSVPARVDIAYVDANHTYEATKRYADFLLDRLQTKGVLAIDDIHYSEEMERAWQELKQDKQVTTSMDLYHIGMLFVNPCYLKRHYRIRP